MLRDAAIARGRPGHVTRHRPPQHGTAPPTVVGADLIWTVRRPRRGIFLEVVLVVSETASTLHLPFPMPRNSSAEYRPQIRLCAEKNRSARAAALLILFHRRPAENKAQHLTEDPPPRRHRRPTGFAYPAATTPHTGRKPR